MKSLQENVWRIPLRRLSQVRGQWWRYSIEVSTCVEGSKRALPDVSAAPRSRAGERREVAVAARQDGRPCEVGRGSASSCTPRTAAPTTTTTLLLYFDHTRHLCTSFLMGRDTGPSARPQKPTRHRQKDGFQHLTPQPVLQSPLPPYEFLAAICAAHALTIDHQQHTVPSVNRCRHLFNRNRTTDVRTCRVGVVLAFGVVVAQEHSQMKTAAGCWWGHKEWEQMG